jgi:hypothetical protein
MTDGTWRDHRDDLGIVRWRFKTAEVILGIKGSSACLAVSSSPLQHRNLERNRFDAAFDFDPAAFAQVSGFVVPCPTK